MYEARDWAHGVMIGAGMASETTAAAVGQVGVVRRDSMAMKPFCGYNFADYWTHWLSFEGKVKQLPKIFHVNWFRQDKDGKFLWPGFGDNLRVLSWIIYRCEGRAKGHDTPIGLLPHKEDLDLAGLDCRSRRCTSCSTSTSPPGTTRSTTSAATSRSSASARRQRCAKNTAG